jgi:hypothetical protein
VSLQCSQKSERSCAVLLVNHLLSVALTHSRTKALYFSTCSVSYSCFSKERPVADLEASGRLREAGNKCFKEKRFQEALEAYTQVRHFLFYNYIKKSPPLPILSFLLPLDILLFLSFYPLMLSVHLLTVFKFIEHG